MNMSSTLCKSDIHHLGKKLINLPIVVNTNVILQLEFNTSGVGVASIILTTDVTVAIGIKHLRCLVCCNSMGYYRNYSHA
jgi:hypothetical protein